MQTLLSFTGGVRTLNTVALVIWPTVGCPDTTISLTLKIDVCNVLEIVNIRHANSCKI